MLRTLVVDDEKLARDRLCGFLRGIDGVEVIGEAANGPEAVAMIEDRRPDLVLLDVQMPGMDGFGVLRQITHKPAVVFATAYDNYAIKAFEVQAADYLLKPISRDRLRETVSRISDRRARAVADADLQQAMRAMQARDKRYAPQLTVQKGRQILLLATSDVYWFEVEYRLVYAHTAERAYMTNFTLRELEERLDPELFFRAHKASLVNMRQVKEIVPWFGGRYKLVMRDQAGSEVPVSRAQARTLRAKLRW